MYHEEAKICVSLQLHMQSITKSAIYHLKNISRFWASLTDSVAETLIHTFIICHLDYCHQVLYVLNSAAGVFTLTKPWQHITPTLTDRHWLPSCRSCISYKILLTYKSLHALAPHLTSSIYPFLESAVLRLRSGHKPPHQPRVDIYGHIKKTPENLPVHQALWGSTQKD